MPLKKYLNVNKITFNYLLALLFINNNLTLTHIFIFVSVFKVNVIRLKSI